MQYIKLDNDTWVEVDTDRNTSRIVRKSDVEQQLTYSQSLKEAELSDELLLEWAKENHPTYERNASLDATIATCQELLTHLV